MKVKLLKMMNVKSIVTLVLTLVFAYLSIIQVVQEQQFMTVFTVVISFYYGTQSIKRANASDEQ
ncbi:hypothetical protein GSF08_09720 [Clostridiaceae bacterium DONG20-135]|uniref:Uncharacterized protein n=1 Tax=Copranaerobaculum intestinale TaxID=2692629 RepID=A0A6N8UBW0_9FIRM|nr:hypothetical protein [Copranaerobaculum intestinale]MXQ74213.1 hypothetical protein [Copranaerobaculum intestinale]